VKQRKTFSDRKSDVLSNLVHRNIALCVEALEHRALLSVTIQPDYSLDTTGFFDDPNRRVFLQAALDALGSKRPAATR